MDTRGLFRFGKLFEKSVIEEICHKLLNISVLPPVEKVPELQMVRGWGIFWRYIVITWLLHGCILLSWYQVLERTCCAR